MDKSTLVEDAKINSLFKEPEEGEENVFDEIDNPNDPLKKFLPDIKIAQPVHYLIEPFSEYDLDKFKKEHPNWKFVKTSRAVVAYRYDKDIEFLKEELQANKVQEEGTQKDIKFDDK